MTDCADPYRASTRRPPDCRSPAHWSKPTWIVVAAAALTLAGCNSNQTITPASQRTLGDIYPNYSPYNPIEYAQTSGFYGGR
jgi:hypothetical protein